MSADGSLDCLGCSEQSEHDKKALEAFQVSLAEAILKQLKMTNPESPKVLPDWFAKGLDGDGLNISFDLTLASDTKIASDPPKPPVTVIDKIKENGGVKIGPVIVKPIEAPVGTPYDKEPNKGGGAGITWTF